MGNGLQDLLRALALATRHPRPLIPKRHRTSSTRRDIYYNPCILRWCHASLHPGLWGHNQLNWRTVNNLDVENHLSTFSGMTRPAVVGADEVEDVDCNRFRAEYRVAGP